MPPLFKKITVFAVFSTFLFLSDFLKSQTNQDPVITSNPPTQVWNDETYEYVISSFDADGEAVTINADNLPGWLSLQADAGGVVSNFAGSGEVSYADGSGTNASFASLGFMVWDNDGNIYVTDRGNHRIRKILPDGTVSHFAGSGDGYSRDGSTDQAGFWNMEGLAFDSKGNMFVGDAGAIRMISPDGVVSTLAGQLNHQGYAEGTGTEALFFNASGLAVDSQDNLYVADGGSHRIRKVTPQGVVSTFAGSGSGSFKDGTGTEAMFNIPRGLTIDENNNLYVADSFNNRIRKITSEGVVSTIAGSGGSSQTDGTGTFASFMMPRNITIDSKGNLYVTSNGHNVRKIDGRFVVTLLAGNSTSGSQNGRGSETSFSYPSGIVVDPSGNLFVADSGNSIIRKISGEGYVLSGDAMGQSGSQTVLLSASDANGGSSTQSFEILVNDISEPRFASEPLLTIDEEQTYLYLVDAELNAGGSVALSASVLPTWLTLEDYDQGVVSTFVGSGSRNYQDGTGTNAHFKSPNGIVRDSEGNFYVADEYNNRIRKITTEGEVTTLAGSNQGYADGTGTEAMFYRPSGIAIDDSGNLYVVDTYNQRIRKVSSSGIVTTLAGSGSAGFADGTGTEAMFRYPEGVVLDNDGQVYIADSGNSRIRKITSDGIVSSFLGGDVSASIDGTGTEAYFSRPTAIAIDENGVIYVTSISDNNIRRISPELIVTTIAGSGSSGFKDGTGTRAEFAYPNGIAVHPDGNIYVSDRFNNRIRKITPSGVVTTIAGSGINSFGDGTGSEAVFWGPIGLVIDPDGNLYVSDSFESRIRKITFPLVALKGDPTGQLGDHNVTLIATDGSENTVEQSFAISVVDITAPVFISDLKADFVTGNSGPAYLAEVSERNPVTFSLGTINDETSFTIDGSSGILSFLSAPDFLNPADGNGDNIYDVEVIASDGPNQTSQVVSVQVVDQSANSSPFFTSKPVTQVWQNEVYEYFIASSDKDFDNVSVAATTIPSWISLKRNPGGEVSTFAGSGLPTTKDGTGLTAGLGNLRSMAVDIYNNIYMVDNNRGSVRKITPAGVVSTLAGGGTSGLGVGTGADVKFEYLGGLVVDEEQNVFLLADFSIKKITPEGVVSIFVGSGQPGNSNGTGAEAAFSSSGYLVFDQSKNLYLADTYNNVIRKVTQEGVVTTLAGSGSGTFADGSGTSASFFRPEGITIDQEGNLYVADRANRRIRKISPESEVSTLAGSGNYGHVDGSGTNVRFQNPVGLTIDWDGNLFLADHSKIRKITPTGEVSTYAGQESQGYQDGDRLDALFNSTVDVKFDNSNNLFITDAGNYRIRKLNGESYLLTGSPVGQIGSHDVTLTAIDGKGGSVVQDFEVNVIDASDPIFTSDPILDAGENLEYQYEIKVESENDEEVSIIAIEKPEWLSIDMLSSAVVDTYVGYGGAVLGTDGSPFISFNQPMGLAVDDSDNLYIVDSHNNKIRKVTSGGLIYDFAGAGSNFLDGAFADGTGTDARFKAPSDVAIDESGNLYITDTFNHRIRKITPEGVVTTLAGSGEAGFQDGTGTNAIFSSPQGIVIDSQGNLFVTDPSNQLIRKITAQGVVSSYTGMAGYGSADGALAEAQFATLGAIAIDKEDNLYVIDRGPSRIRKIDNTGTVSTLAGSDSGYQDGTGTEAKFVQPEGLDVDGDGNVYVTDAADHRVRVISKDGVVRTLAGSGERLWVDGRGSEASFSNPGGIVVTTGGSLFITDGGNRRIRKITFPHAVLQGNPGSLLGPHSVQLKATATGGGESTQSFTINVKDLTAPLFTSQNQVNYREGTAVIAYSAVATDVNAVSYTLGTEKDEALFSINSTTGEVSFLTSPDFENPGDGDADNNYIIKVNATDGVNESSLAVTITVTDGREGDLLFTSTPLTVIGDNEPYIYNITTNDPDQSAITMGATTLPDWLKLTTEEPDQVTTYAGSVFGFKNGPANTAKFSYIKGIAADKKGNIYVTEIQSDRLRKISYDGTVTWLAGSGRSGYGDGLGLSAHFNAPSAMALDVEGNIYLTDIGNHRIRKVTPTGMVTTFAGSGKRGFEDGTGNEASFSSPEGITLDASGNIYVSEYGNHAIRKITPEGIVSTIAGTGEKGSANGTGTTASFNEPYGLDIDAAGNLYVADHGNRLIRKIDTQGVVTTLAGSGNNVSMDGQGTLASFRSPSGLVFGPDDNVYVSDRSGHKIQTISPSGEVTTLAGTGTAEAIDGDLSTASFSSPADLTFDQYGNLFISGAGSSRIRKISAGGSILSGTPGTNLGEHSVSLTAGDEFGSAEQSFTISVQRVTAEITSILRKTPVLEEIHSASAVFTVVFNKDVTNVDESDFELNSSGATGNVFWVKTIDSRTYEVNLLSLSTGLIDIDLKADNDIVDLSGATLGSLTPGEIEETYTNRNQTPEITSEPITTVDEDKPYSYPITVSDPDLDPMLMAESILPDWLSIEGERSGFVTLFSGSGSNGSQDGLKDEASFRYPGHIVMDDLGNVYLTDVLSNTIRKINPEGAVSTLAGSGNYGSINATGTAASFAHPEGITVIGSGNLIVADAGNNVLRMITPEGIVSTFAGSGSHGSVDGTALEASFQTPTGIVLSPNGNLYVTESGSRIREVTLDGVVTTFAGSGDYALVDGTGLNASFNQPTGLTVDSEGNLYVADTQNHAIRKITEDGVVTTIAGNGVRGFADGLGTDATFSGPRDIYANNSGDLFVADTENHLIRKITSQGMVTTFAGDGSNGSSSSGYDALNASFHGPKGIIGDAAGNLFVAERNGRRIRKISVGDLMLSGNPFGKVGEHPVTIRFKDSFGELAEQSFTLTVNDDNAPTFTSAEAATFIENETGTVYAATVTAINPVTFSLGTAKDEPLFSINATDGLISFLSPPDFESPADGDGDNNYLLEIIADDGVKQTSHVVTVSVTDVSEFDPVFTSSPVTTVNDDSFYQYKITTSDEDGDAVDITSDNLPEWLSLSAGTYNVTTWVGSGESAQQDGTGTEASFSATFGMAVDESDNLYIAEFDKVRKVTPDGVVSTLVTTGEFIRGPSGLAFDKVGNLIIADWDGHKIVKVSPEGVASLIAGSNQSGSADGNGSEASFISPSDLVIDEDNNIYVADFSSHLIRKISPEGQVTTLAGTGEAGYADGTGTESSFNGPVDLAIDDAGDLFVADFGNNVVRKITPEGLVTTYAGTGQAGFKDGARTSAQFNNPAGIGVDNLGHLLVADNGNSRLRQITTSGWVSTVAGSGTAAYADGDGEQASFSALIGITVDSRDNVFVSNGSRGKRIRKLNRSSALLSGDASTQSGTHNVLLTATDNADGEATQSFSITINDVTAPMFNSGTAMSQVENTIMSYQASATDNNLFVYSFGTGNDEALFVLNESTGELSFIESPDFENPKDSDQNNDYVIEIMATDVATNASSLTLTITVTDIEEIAPVITISSTESSRTNAQPINVSFTLSEEVLGFTIDDLTISNGLATNFTGSGTSYSVDLSPVTDGELTVDIAANVMTDLVGNDNEAATQFSIVSDRTAPLITIDTTEPAVTNAESFEITFTLSEEVEGFTVEDVMTESAVFSDFTGSGTFFMATLTPLADGDIPISIADGLMMDLAGNENEPADPFVLTSDRTAPMVTITSAESSVTNSTSFDITITLNEAVTGFTVDDLTTVNGTVSDFSGSGTAYTATISPVIDGEVTVDIGADMMTDLADNGNVATTQFSIVSDRTAPSIAIGTEESNSTNAESFDITFTLSEEVEGFTTADVTVANGTLSDFLGSGTSYTASISPTSDGEVTVDIAAGAMTDLAGNANLAANQLSITSDQIAPTVTISSAISGPTNAASFDLSFIISEEVEGFTAADVTVVNGTLSNFLGSGTTYTASISPTSDGEVTIDIAAGTMTDAGGNTNEKAEFAIESDQTKPVSTLTGPADALINQAFTATITYTEEVAGFTIDDLSLTNATASDFTSIVEGKEWTVLMTPAADGIVSMDLPAGTAMDLAGNTNLAAATLSVGFDGTAPEVTAITRKGDNPLLSTSAVFQVTFSEAVAGVDQADFELVLTGTATAAISSVSQTDAQNYEVTTDQVSGEGSIGLNLKDDDSISDTAGNILSGDFTGETYTTNFSPTAMALSSTSLAENSGADVVVGTVSAEDPDAADTHTFTLVSGDGADDNASFSIDGDQLKAAEDFDFETKDTYSIRVRADDGKGGVLEQIFIVDITNVSEPAMTLEGTLAFDQVGKGSTSDLSFTINNTGDGALDVSDISLPADFTADWSGGTIAFEGSQTVTVTFSPSEVKVYSGEVSVTSVAGTSTLTVSGEGTLVTSIDNDFVEAEEVNIYPNPATEFITVDLTAFAGRSVTIIIQDITGRVRLTKLDVRDNKVSLNVRGYEEGLFILHLSDSKSEVYKKFMIKR